MDEEKLRRKAEHLPEDGVPPELVRLLGHDNDLDKLQVQKAATPVEGRREDLTDAARAFASQSPNAVVMEKSSNEEADINALRVHAVRSLAESLAVVPSKQLDHVEPKPAKQRTSNYCSGKLGERKTSLRQPCM